MPFCWSGSVFSHFLLLGARTRSSELQDFSFLSLLLLCWGKIHCVAELPWVHSKLMFKSECTWQFANLELEQYLCSVSPVHKNVTDGETPRYTFVYLMLCWCSNDVDDVFLNYRYKRCQSKSPICAVAKHHLNMNYLTFLSWYYVILSKP